MKPYSSCFLVPCFLALLSVAPFMMGRLIEAPRVVAEDSDDAPLSRARKQAKMLDTLYKTAIVIVTTHYVNERSDLAAGDAFQLLFQSMKDHGFHEVRLLDATGDPIDPDNLPKDDFEKSAVKAMLDGKPIFEQVVTDQGQRKLRSVTPLPVVMEKCTLCHANYEGKKVIGALGITIPVE